MLVPVAVFLAPLIVAAIAIRYERHATMVRVSGFADAALASRWLPPVCGLISGLIMAWVWSGSHFIPNVADESAYVLQAKIFARGAWSLAARPLPEFFEQMHVFVTPFLASKYFPGESILLVPGVLVGFPPLVPLLLIFGSGLLIVALGRRITNGWIALLAWAFWTTARANFRFLPSYFSETTTVFLWLLGWWALYDWHLRPRRRTLILLSLCIAWALITRPLTGLVFAVPAISVAVWSARRHRLLAEIRYAVLVGVAVISIVPLWSRFTTGRWSQTPQSLYTRTYMPWDVIGFGVDTTPPLRAMPVNQASEIDGFMALHQSHTVGNLPHDAMVRLVSIDRDVFTGWRAGLVAYFVLGLFALSPALAIGGIAALLLFVAYLAYAHPGFWTIYYLEALPVVAVITVLGFALAMKWMRRNIEQGGETPRSAEGRDGREGAGSLVGIVLAFALLVGSLPLARSEREIHTRSGAARRALWEIMALLPTPSNVLLVRDERKTPRSMVTNDVDPANARTWLAHDLGSENVRLQRLLPDRTAYLFDVNARTLIQLPPIQDSTTR
ncbi:MAG TPA: hypothetical protein VK544_00145 [Gemmatimonadaceae bacterium]|nr:hypothetical protein [Gemmatimonadaceae bacterium]